MSQGIAWWYATVAMVVVLVGGAITKVQNEPELYPIVFLAAVVIAFFGMHRDSNRKARTDND